MKRMIIVWIITLLFIKSTAQEQALYFIPQPESVMLTDGSFKLSNTTTIFLPQKYVSDLKPYVLDKIKSDIGLEVSVATGRAKSDFIKFQISKDKNIKEEGYILKVSSSGILISAKDYGGFFNGFQTLRQLFPLENTATATIQSIEVKDNPRFAWRGLMLDVSRHFQSKDFILKQIDILSSYKINKFHWHLTDDQGWRIEIDAYPNLTKKGAWRAEREGITWWQRKPATAEEPKTVGGFYTKADIKEVIAYAKIRNVEVIPEIDVPGHSKALIASYPELFCYDTVPDGVNFEVAVGGKAPDNAVCAGKETSYAFLQTVIKEVADLFPSNYLHIGGDECNKRNWKKCPHCQGKMKDNNLNDEEELQSYFVQRLHKMVEAEGKTMIGWDEVLSGNGVKGATIMAWRRGNHTPEIQAPREGYPTIMTSYQYMYISQVQGPSFMEPEGPKVVLPLSKVYGHEPLPAELTPTEAKLVLGNQASLWGEFTPTEEHCEYMLYPRTLASAEVSWSNPKLKNWGYFQKSMENFHFKKLEKDGVNFSKSVFSVYASYALNQLSNQAYVYLNTEAVHYTIRYTTNGDDPEGDSSIYTKEFDAPAKSLLKAGLFNNHGKLVGNITELRLK